MSTETPSRSPGPRRVVDHCFWNKFEGIAGVHEPVPKVRIFHVREWKILVKTTHFLEGGAEDKDVAGPKATAGNVDRGLIERRSDAGEASCFSLVHTKPTSCSANETA
jgi:hypothetical protein